MRAKAIAFTVTMLLRAARLEVAQFKLPTVHNTQLGYHWAGPNSWIKAPIIPACRSRSRSVGCRLQPHVGSIFLMVGRSALC